MTLAAPVQTAQAAGVCGGSRIDSKPLTSSGGSVKGHVELWYSSANNGTNCVVTYDDTTGRNNMKAQIQVSGGSVRCDPSGCGWGYYETYAGPVTVTNTNGKCIWFYGAMVNYSTEYKYASGWSHCG